MLARLFRISRRARVTAPLARVGAEKMRHTVRICYSVLLALEPRRLAPAQAALSEEPSSPEDLCRVHFAGRRLCGICSLSGLVFSVEPFYWYDPDASRPLVPYTLQSTVQVVARMVLSLDSIPPRLSCRRRAVADDQRLGSGGQCPCQCVDQVQRFRVELPSSLSVEQGCRVGVDGFRRRA